MLPVVLAPIPKMYLAVSADQLEVLSTSGGVASPSLCAGRHASCGYMALPAGGSGFGNWCQDVLLNEMRSSRVTLSGTRLGACCTGLASALRQI